MPHQCIQCGNVIPSGSPQILQGCSQCGGKKFYFTSEALSQDERDRMMRRADQDINELLDGVFKKEKELAEALEKGGLLEEEWVKVTPAPTEDGGEVIIEGAGDPEKTGEGTGADGKGAGEEGTGHKAVRPVRVAVSKKVRLSARPGPSSAPPGEGAIAPGGPAGRSGKARGIKPQLSPEVIHMIEPGVYEIDLEGLLDKSPMIVNRDGTYLIHLPSVMPTAKRKKA
jgi:predicted  nucleic acid-binding Zn-ribbon protein